MKAKVFSQDGTSKTAIDLPDSVFGVEVNEHLMFLVVKSLLANQRQGTAKTKTRAEVSGGGKKPWKQKGTGRARAGSNTSPLWVRGSKAHGPVPRDYSNTIPQKMRRAALKSALSSRAKDEKILVIDAIKCDEAKTKIIAALLKAVSLTDKRNLLIINNGNEKVYRAGRNIKNLDIKKITDINAYDILKNENIIFGEQDLVKKVEEVVAK